jgi:hypothetical protein
VAIPVPDSYTWEQFIDQVGPVQCLLLYDHRSQLLAARSSVQQSEAGITWENQGGGAQFYN